MRPPAKTPQTTTPSPPVTGCVYAFTPRLSGRKADTFFTPES